MHVQNMVIKSHFMIPSKTCSTKTDFSSSFPSHMKSHPFHLTLPDLSVIIIACRDSQIFFLGFKTLSGFLLYPDMETRSPGFASECTFKGSVPVSLTAHRSMPWDSMPRILAGLRLHRKTDWEP